MMSSGMVLVGAMQIIVLLIVALALNAVPVLVAVLDPTACILGTKNVPKVLFS
jgi:hypothetical protein